MERETGLEPATSKLGNLPGDVPTKTITSFSFSFCSSCCSSSAASASAVAPRRSEMLGVVADRERPPAAACPLDLTRAGLLRKCLGRGKTHLGFPIPHLLL